MPVTDPLTDQLKAPGRVVVLRSFKGEHVYLRGELVETTDWLPTNLSRQLDRRYIANLPYGYDDNDSVLVEVDGVDRIFMNQGAADEAVALVAAKQEDAERTTQAALAAEEAEEPSEPTEDEDDAETAMETDSADTTSKEAAPPPKVEKPKTTRSTRSRS